MIFFLKEAIDVTLHIISGRSFQISGASKAKLRKKCLTDPLTDTYNTYICPL